MNLRRKDIADIMGDSAYGLNQAGDAASSGLTSELIVVPAQMAYLEIPAKELRNFVDGIFPAFAKNSFADSASGFGHRYRAGHDLLMDVPQTIYSQGSYEGFRHAAHIILTDFPTRAGIPIPGFSQSGLGNLLEQAGIHNGWLQVSFFDTGIGVLALAEGSSTLTQALQGNLVMDFGTACQTFGTGGVEIGFAMATQNPLLLAGGIQDVLAGVVSTWKTYSVYVDPLDFFGAAGTSALLGFGIAHGLVGENLKDATLDAIRSGTIGALYSVSTAFGYGALAGFVVCRLAGALAKHHREIAQGQLSVDSHSYGLLIQELCSGNIAVKTLLANTEPKWIPRLTEHFSGIKLDDSPLSPLDASPLTRLDDSPLRLLDDSPARPLDASPLTLLDDTQNLLHIYRACF